MGGNGAKPRFKSWVSDGLVISSFNSKSSEKKVKGENLGIVPRERLHPRANKKKNDQGDPGHNANQNYIGIPFYGVGIYYRNVIPNIPGNE